MRMLFERELGENRDRVVWGFHVDAASAPSASTWQTMMAFAWGEAPSHFGVVMQQEYDASQFQVYDVSAGGPPVSEELADPALFPITGNSGPQEVQVCVTRWTDDSIGRERKHGRWYVGPISGSYLNAARPASALQTRIQQFQQALHAQFTSNGMDPVVVSRTTGLATGYPITQYSIDNAWDTQRRRGIDPTDELVFPVVAP